MTCEFRATTVKLLRLHDIMGLTSTPSPLEAEHPCMCHFFSLHNESNPRASHTCEKK